MLPFKVVYHDKYDLNLGPHVFPSQKFRLIAEALIAEKIAARDDVVQPEPASDEDILRVHTPDWVRKLKTGTLTASDVMLLEIPYSRELVEAVWLAAGGSILAAQRALRDGFGANIGGGFHHAYPDHGEGFCAIHDVAVAIRRLQADGAIRRAIVVDTDVHHGNGTAAIFRGDPSVFTISIHQLNNYPGHKPPSSVDLNMADRVDDDEYLGALLPAVEKALDEFRPEILFYIGGADPFCEDQLGGLSLTKKGLMERDRRVFEEARRRGIPVVTTLAGGYARRVEDTVRIHVNTILA
ncbi:MAG TPA: histone deacetylase, partial [Candidatus Acidoferrum sp.]